MSSTTASESVPTLVSCSWLKENLNNPKVKILDSSWYVPGMDRSPGLKYDAHKEFETRRIPGALYFDIDKVADTSTDLPHMIPTPAFFAECAGRLGLRRDDHVVVYDGKGLFSAPRAWYTLKHFGHPAVSMLEGGFPAWEAAAGPVDTAPLPCAAPAPTPAEYPVPAAVCSQIMSVKDVEAHVANPKTQLVDARPKARFIGEAPEPRPIESGHIENTLNVPWPDVLASPGTLKPEAELRQVFAANRVDLGQPIAVTCGSGNTACVVAAALYELKCGLVPLYDGAYTEWKTSGRPTYKAWEKTPYAAAPPA